MAQDDDMGLGGAPQKACVQKVTEKERMKLTAIRQCEVWQAFPCSTCRVFESLKWRLEEVQGIERKKIRLVEAL